VGETSAEKWVQFVFLNKMWLKYMAEICGEDKGRNRESDKWGP
jgi:hypothetical protein